MHSLTRNRIAHCQSGSSDKVYIASCRQLPNGKWVVLGKWGRRGANMSAQAKGDEYDSEREAKAALDALFDTKRREGYVDINDGFYNGPVTATSVKQYLEPDPGALNDQTRTTPQAVDEEKEKQIRKAANERAAEVRAAERAAKVADAPARRKKCINVLGLEDQFVEGEHYDTFPHADNDMLWVVNMNGERVECFKERFT